MMGGTRIPVQPAASKMKPSPPRAQPRTSPKAAPDASGPLASALGLLSLVPAAVALALLLGAGMLRQGAPVLVSVGAGLLVLLPSLGVGVLFRRRMLGFALGLLLWPTAVVVGFPLYFPGERAEALASGTTVLLLPFGLAMDPELAETVDALLPAPDPVRKLAPRAEVLPVEPLPPSTVEPPLVEAGDLVVLPYEGEGRTLAVQVGLDGQGQRSLDRWMLFDTGATLTTLDRTTLAGLGVEVRTDAPEVTVRTAAGDRRTRLALLDRVWIGGMEVEGVTVSVCDACADEDTVGLLGLNVSGRFRVTVDTARHELVLEPRTDEPDRSIDVAPWLDIEATATRWRDGRIEVEVRAVNHSSRTIQEAQVGIRCDDTWVAELRNIPPRGRATSLVALPVGADCDGYTVGLERALW